MCSYGFNGFCLNQTKPLSQSIRVSYMNHFMTLSSIKGQMFTEIQSNHIIFYYRIHVNFSLPLSLVMSLPIIILLLLITTLVRLQHICSNHLSLISLSLSLIGASPTMSRMLIFLVLSFLILSHIYLNILISATLNFVTC